MRLESLGGNPNRYFHHVMGKIALAERDYATAIQRFEESCGESGKSNLYCFPLMKALVLNGNIEEAIKELEDMVNVWGRYAMDYAFYSAFFYPYGLFTLGTLYERSGEIPKAIQTYSRLLEIWKQADEDLPELIDAKERLAKLKTIG